MLLVICDIGDRFAVVSGSQKIQHFRLSKFKGRTLAGVGGREDGSSVSYEFWISGSFRSVEDRHTGNWVQVALWPDVCY